MTQVTLRFEGFVQVRLATDPDPCDEPRGVSGWTHAVAGEPDLDRVLVLQDDSSRRVRRSHGPKVGVAVTKVAVDGADQAGHPLIGSRVSLLDEPRFEGRNWIIETDGREPIDPIHLQISRAGFRLRGKDVIEDEAGTRVAFYRATPAQLKRRIPTAEGGPPAAAELFAALGIPDADPSAWRRRRRTALEADLADADPADPVAVPALERRIADLREAGVAESTVGVRMRYRHALNSEVTVSDPDHLLQGSPDTGADWPLEFWVGGWDADAFCMYLRGALVVPVS